MPPARRIAIVIDLDWTLKHHHEVFAGTQRYAREQGWESVIWPHPPADLGRRRGRKAYDGIIARVTPQLAQQAARARIPLVNVWLSSPVTDVPAVVPDIRAAGRLAAEHLLGRGFRRFGFVGYARTRASTQLEAGIREGARREGLDLSRLLTSSSFSRSAQSWGRFQSRLTAWIENLRPPVGVLAINDKPARYVANAARQMGLDVPADVGVVGLGNETVVCLNPEPTLTSTEFGFHRVGYRAGELLDELMDGGAPPQEAILVPPLALVPRGSTDAFAVDDEVVAQALRFIADQCHRPIKVSDVAAVVPVSWRSLERRFRKCRGWTINKEITRLRIEHVKRLLVETEMSVKKVATACGFANTRRLCEVFRHAEETTPGQYRRKHTADTVT